MTDYSKVLRKLASHDKDQVAFGQYVQGDDAALKRISIRKEYKEPFEVGELIERLPNVDALDDLDRRVLRGAIRFGAGLNSRAWVAAQLVREPAIDVFATLLELAKSAGVDVEVYGFDLAFYVRQLLREDGELNSVGRFVAGLPDARLNALCQAEYFPMKGLRDLIAYFARAQPKRLLGLIGQFARDQNTHDWDPTQRPAGWLIEYGGPKVVAALEALVAEQKLPDRIHTLLALAHGVPERWRERGLRELLECVAKDKGGYRHPGAKVATQLVRTFGPAALPGLVALAKQRSFAGNEELLAAASEVLGSSGLVALCEVVHAGKDTSDQLTAVRALLARPEGEARSLASAILLSTLALLAERYAQPEFDKNTWGRSDDEKRKTVREKISEDQRQALRLAGEARGAELAPAVLAACEHPQQPVRTVAAAAYGRILGDGAIAKASELLAGNAQERKTAIQILRAVGTSAAVAALEAHESRESDAELRALMMSVLVPGWRATGRTLGMETVQAWIERAGKRAEKPPAKWYDAKKLPKLLLQSGKKPLDPTAAIWLCKRQAESPDATVDAEAGVLIGLLERKSAADWVLALWTAWTEGNADVKEKWVLGLLAGLGDDRVVEPLYKRTVLWTEKQNRLKMAAMAPTVLAAVGSDQALMLLSDLAARYARKWASIGDAATSALEQVARARNVTLDELGDRVPRFDFDGTVRAIAGAPLRVRVADGGKLAYHDANDEPLARLPKGVSAAAKAELKRLAEEVELAFAAQRHRHERMLVSQRRWPAAKWHELYDAHPVSSLFASRLVWASYDRSGVPSATFRRFDDGSLTSADDEPVELAKDALVGIVHPSELDRAGLAAWQRHFGDHELEQPIVQLERVLHRVSEEQRGERELETAKDVELRAGLFRRGAARRGWSAGTIDDDDHILDFVRSFPVAGVDALLRVSGIFVNMDDMDELRLGTACFVKTGSVRFERGEDDSPEDSGDPRVLRLGDVPALAFSETLAALEWMKAVSDRDEDEA